MNALPTNDSGPSRMALQHHDVACIRRAAGQRITVMLGSVWITHHGRREDFCLGIGDTYRIPSDETTLISPLGHDAGATIMLAPAERITDRRTMVTASQTAARSAPTGAPAERHPLVAMFVSRSRVPGWFPRARAGAHT